MEKEITREQINFICEEYQGKLYYLYNDKIEIHTLKYNDFFESIYNEIKELISVENQTDKDTVVLNNKPLT